MSFSSSEQDQILQDAMGGSVEFVVSKGKSPAKSHDLSRLSESSRSKLGENDNHNSDQKKGISQEISRADKSSHKQLQSAQPLTA